MNQRLTARPALQQGARPVQQTVAARPGDYMSALPQGGGELDGLLKGLSALNPVLAGYTADAARKEQEADKAAGAAFAQQVQNPNAVLNGEEAVSPVPPPPAVSDNFRATMRDTLAQRAGIEVKSALAAQYDQNKDNPDFNVKGWLQEERVKALRGVADPTMQASLGAHFTELESNILADANRRVAARAEEVRKASLDARAGDTFTANLSADQMHAAWPAFLEKSRADGFSAAEAAQAALLRVAHASTKAGGMPELFDVFDRRGPDGVPIGGGPLLPQLQQARQQAVAMREKAIHEATEGSRAVLYKGYVDDIDKAPEKVTWERLMNDIGPHGLTAKEAAAYWDRRNEVLADKAGVGALDALAAAGALWTLPAAKQTKYLETAGQGVVQAWASAQEPAQVAAIGAKILQMHTTTGASIPMDVVKRRIETTVSNLPDAAGPSPAFQGMAELYKALSANPATRDLYFDANTSKVMKAFTEATGRSEDPATAYVGAYRHTSPEYIKAAEEYKRSPEFAKLQQKDLSTFISGSSSWRPKWMGGAYAENAGVVNTWAREAAVKFRAENPWATDADMEQHLERETSRNWVLDKTSGVAVQISPNENAAAQQEAISAYTARLTKEAELPDGWKIVMLRNGDQGSYSVYKANGAGKTLVADVHIDKLMATHVALTTLSPTERAEIGRAQLKLRKGESLADADIAAISKARGLGLLKGTDLDQVRDFERRAFKDRMSEVPQILLDKPTMNDLRVPSGSRAVDYGVTSRVANDFLNGGMRNVTASLVTMGEAVALTAYDDPAKGAGKNIGMGYNLQANAKSVNEDLRRAGVPPERIEDVKNGKASLTEMQAKKLLLVALPRYEKRAMETAEEVSPGLWRRMTEGQRAVMTDIAYQVGSVDKFKKAWEALAKGDMARFKEEATVTYVARDGTRKADTRRNNLRSALLSGMPLWEASIQQTGKLPSNKLDALALNSR